jgi:alkyl sulfatase BDS1-like metallo-beta-lactamase superfamily hydrolase
MLRFTDRQDFEDAKKRVYCRASKNGGLIKNNKGRIVWDPSKYSFVKGSGQARADTLKSVCFYMWA